MLFFCVIFVNVIIVVNLYSYIIFTRVTFHKSLFFFFSIFYFKKSIRYESFYLSVKLIN